MGEQQALDIHAKGIVPPRFENYLTENLEPFRDVRGDKEVDLPEAERGCVTFQVASVKGDVTESPYAQERLVEVHSFREGMFSLRLRLRLTGRSGLGGRWLGDCSRGLRQSRP